MVTRDLLFGCLFSIALVACSKTPDVKVTKSKETTIEAVVSGVSSGKTEAEHHSVLAFGAVGRIEQVNAVVGSFVKKGDVLATLENADLKAALDQAQREVTRVAQLKTSNVLSTKEVENAIELRDIALGAYEKSLIRAPFDGFITEKNIEKGQLSQITAVLPVAPLRIVDNEPRYAVVAVDEVDLPKIAIGQKARIKVLAYQKTPLEGTVRKVISYVSTAREQDRTIQVELTIAPQEKLLPVGASADVDIITETKNAAITLPSRAIMGRVGARFVYLIKNSKTVKQPVITGLSNLERTEVIDGITSRDLVVTSSDAVELKEGQKVHTIEE